MRFRKAFIFLLSEPKIFFYFLSVLKQEFHGLVRNHTIYYLLTEHKIQKENKLLVKDAENPDFYKSRQKADKS